MSNPRDEIDSWLDREIEPLAPPPGRFERISRQARRRKAKQAVMSAAAAVVVIAAGIAVPRVAAALLHGGTTVSGQVAAASGPATARAASGTGRAAGTPSAPHPTPVPSGPGPVLSTTPGNQPVVSGFQPTSITLLGPDDGAVLGMAGCGGQQCTSMAGTADYGSSWYGLSPPAAGPPDGALGVSELRFLNLQDGWAFGPQLFATTDGGAVWTRQQTPAGLRVTDLEAAGKQAFALFAACTGSGEDYAADCTSFSLYAAAPGGGWQVVPVPAGYLPMTTGRAGLRGAASLVLASGTRAQPESGAGYVLTPSGALLRGGLQPGAAWRLLGHIPAGCQVGAAQPGGQPAGAQLASGALAQGPALLLACDGPAAGGTQRKIIYLSSDGRTWHRQGLAPAGGAAASLAAADGGLTILATSTGIDISTDSGASWTPASISAAPAGGFSYVGMTTGLQGVAVPADPGQGEVFITRDGGQTWTPSPLSRG